MYAIAVFERTPCTFYVLHAHQVSPSGLISTMNKERGTRLYTIMAGEEQKKLDKIMDRLRKVDNARDHFFEGHLVAGSLLSVLRNWALRTRADFIVMGTQGATGLKEIFMGSNTVKVIRNIDFCPVVAVPEHYDFLRPEHVLFATEYRHKISKEVLRPLKAIAELWEATINIVHISEERELDKTQQENQKAMHVVLKGMRHTFETLDFYPAISDRVREYAAECDVQLIAMIQTQHSFIRQILREPVIKNVAFRTELPFLVLPEKGQKHAS